MRSFSFLSIAATAAFSLLASAAPTPLTGYTGLTAGAKVNVPRDLVHVSDIEVEDVDVLKRHGLVSVPTILNDLTNDLSTVVAKLDSITGVNATVTEISPLLQQIVDIVGTAVGDVKALVGQPLSIVLATVDPAVQATVTDVAELLAKVLSLVVNALGTVLKIVGGDLAKLGTVLSAVGQILSELVSGILGLVDGLVTELVPLVGGLVPALAQLGFNALGDVLNLVL